MKYRPYKKRIAPRLASGDPRIAWGGRLPDHVKEGLRRIAYTERKSMSWVLEEVVIEFFKLDRPDYVNDPDKAEKGKVLSTARGVVVAHKRQKVGVTIVNPGITITPSGDADEPIAIDVVDPSGTTARVTLSLPDALIIVAVLRAAVDAMLYGRADDGPQP